MFFVAPIWHIHENDVWNGSNVNIHNSPAIYDSDCFQGQHFNSNNTMKNVDSSDNIVLNKFKEQP